MNAQMRAQQVMDMWELESLSALPIERFYDLHTRQLLRLKERFVSGINGINRYTDDGGHWEMLRMLRDKIRTVLSTREHVPNKAEAKLIRRRLTASKRHYCAHR